MSKAPSDTLDLRGIPCPNNSAKALIRIATLDVGEVLEILVDSGEPIENVPQSIEEAGHLVLNRKSQKDHWSLLVEVKG